MTLRKKRQYWYGDHYEDLQAEIRRFSQERGYPAAHFAVAQCACGADTFHLYSDDEAGAAVRVCSGCERQHAIGDSEDYLREAELQKSVCVCDTETLQIAVGVSLYEGSSDVRWLYVGCRCPSCGIVGVYADWKNEYIGFEDLLRRV